MEEKSIMLLVGCPVPVCSSYGSRQVTRKSYRSRPLLRGFFLPPDGNSNVMPLCLLTDQFLFVVIIYSCVRFVGIEWIRRFTVIISEGNKTFSTVWGITSWKNSRILVICQIGGILPPPSHSFIVAIFILR